METSARTGENVDGLFTHLVRALRLVRDGTVLLSEGTPGPLPERPKRQFWQVQRTKPRLSSCVIV